MSDIWDELDDVAHDRKMAALEWDRMNETFGKLGYVEGVEEAKEQFLQQGFDQGYTEGMGVGIRIGRLRACLEILLKQHQDPELQQFLNRISELNANNLFDKHFYKTGKLVLLDQLELDFSKLKTSGGLATAQMTRKQEAWSEPTRERQPSQTQPFKPSSDLKDHKFLKKALSFCKEELRLLGATHSLPGDPRRLQVFRQVFEHFMADFKAFEPLLSEIKREYDTTIELQGRELDKMETIKAKNCMMEFKTAQEISRIRDEAQIQIQQLEAKLESVTRELHQEAEKCKNLKENLDFMMQENKRLQAVSSDTSKLTALIQQYDDYERHTIEQLQEKDEKIMKLQTTKADAILAKREKKKEVVEEEKKTKQVKPDKLNWEYIEMQFPKRAQELWVGLKNRDTNDTIIGLIEKLIVFADRPSAIKGQSKLDLHMKSLHSISGDLKQSRKLQSTLTIVKEISEPPVPELFTGLGIGQHIPKFLRFKGKIVNRKIGLDDLLMLIKDIWEAKTVYDAQKKRMSHMHDFLYIFLKKRFGSQATIAEWGMNIHQATKQHCGASVDCRLFSQILDQEIDCDVYLDLMNQTTRLQQVIQLAEEDPSKSRGMVLKDQLLKQIKLHWPLKTEDQMNELDEALYNDQPGAVITYKLLFGDERSVFLEAFLNQELLGHSQYIAEVDKRLSKDKVLLISEIITTITKYDKNKPKLEMDRLLERGFGQSLDKLDQKQPFERANQIPVQDNTTYTTVFHNPAISTTYVLLSVCLMSFGVLTLYKLGNVIIFNRKILHPSVQNTHFGVFFLLACLGFGLDAVRYGLGISNAKPISSFQEEHWIVSSAVIDAWMLLGSAILRTLSHLFLGLGLHEQILHRSTTAVPNTRFAANRNSAGSTLALSPDILPLPGSRLYPQNGQNEELSETQALLGSPIDPYDEDSEPLEEPAGWQVSLQEFKLKCLEFAKSTEFSFILLTLLRIVDPLRLKDESAISTMAKTEKWPVLLIIGGLLQYGSLLWLSCRILLQHTPQQRGTRSRRQIGPLLWTKVLFFIGTLLILVWALEISVVSRFITETVDVWGQSKLSLQGNLCAVPPWWWIDKDSVSFTGKKVYVAHGWASWLDILQWLGLLGYICIFSAVKREFKRKAILRHLQRDLEAFTSETVRKDLKIVLAQIYGYLAWNKLQYGVLCNREATWFFKRPNNPENSSLLYVSPAVPFDGKDPTLLRAFFYFLSLAQQGHLSGLTPTGTNFPVLQNNASKPNKRTKSFPEDLDVARLHRLIGSGGSSDVYEYIAQDGTRIAVKFTDGKDRNILKLMRDEILIYERLEELQGIMIPRLHFYGFQECAFMIAMTHIEGEHPKTALKEVENTFIQALGNHG
ncbi:hypothetical protein EDD86DRAFT_249182 [Gorgonomyces haynaldii]|nr:hypothetical protein EDD86DRAFT_249182 [Gorgonomyces haynaldii]